MDGYCKFYRSTQEAFSICWMNDRYKSTLAALVTTAATTSMYVSTRVVCVPNTSTVNEYRDH